MPDVRYSPAALRAYATALLIKAGMPEEPAASTARGLVEGDLYDHTTHGLAQLPGYVEEIESGSMAVTGRPDVIADHGAAICWDARRLPGLWTTDLAVTEAMARADKFGLAAVVLRRSHHIACLAAFLEEPARKGYLILVLSSDPGESKVAPHGGLTPVLMPDPIAAGIPRRPDPILIDVSTSITTLGMVGRSKNEGRKLGGLWAQDAEGNLTDDPNVVGNGGTLLHVGGQDHGHKGFGLGLLVEALTQGLGGYGRADKPTDWGAAVTVLAISPSRFAGEDAFLRQMDFTADLCLGSKPRDPKNPVRLPGQLAVAKKRQAEREGVTLHPGIPEKLAALAEKYGIAPLKPA
ncbi:Ldh family oxidoreductase [Dongia sp.]|uniref:Ldh family oxidoreductase n=1 Tax=Dongia sp. TaxID=1977262 RepID=UPI003752180B